MGVHFERGQALFALKRYKEAAEEYLQELEEFPESIYAHVNLAASLINCGDIRGAKEQLEVTLSLAPDFAAGHYIASYYYALRKNNWKAKKAITEAIRLKSSAEYYHRLAEIETAIHSRNKALDATDLALQMDPLHVPSILLRGRLLAELGKIEESKTLLASALQHAPTNAQVQKEMGRLQLAVGETGKALDLLAEARRIDPLKANDKSAIATAYGLMLPGIRSIRRCLLYWHRWSFRTQWFVALICSLFILFGVLATPPRQQPIIPKDLDLWYRVVWHLLLNYLFLPISLPFIARITALIFTKHRFGMGWSIILEIIIALWCVFMIHMGASFLAILFAAMPELLAMIVSSSLCYPLVAILVREQIRWYFGLSLLPIILIQPGFCVIGISIAVYNRNAGWVGWALFLACGYAISWFIEDFAKWASTKRQTIKI